MKCFSAIFALFIAASAVTLTCNRACGDETVVLADIDSGSTSPTGQYRWMDVNNQVYEESYRNTYNYTQASVEVTYSIDANTLHGTLSASNLKPNFAYQFKLTGTPGTSANEGIGLTGRWWQEEWNGTSWANGQNLNNKGDGSSPNPNDDVYFQRRDINDITSPTGKHYRYTGYLVFDYFITDGLGSADFNFQCDSSFHVLWKTSQRVHTSDDGPIKEAMFAADPCSPAYDIEYGLSIVDIFGEWERLPTGLVRLPLGEYEAQFVLTEESFHNCSGFGGCWAAAMAGSCNFSITQCIVNFENFALFADYWLQAGSNIPADFDDSGIVNLDDLMLFVNEWLNICPFGWPSK
jgi:hypothetical protein